MDIAGSCITRRLLTKCSTDADHPYCGTISISDIGYKGFDCFAERNQLVMAAARPTRTVWIVNSISTVRDTVQTTVTVDETTADPSTAAASTSIGGSGGGDDAHKLNEDPSTDTAAITGGAVGGVAFAIFAATLLFILRRRKRKPQEEPKGSSFNVLSLPGNASASQLEDVKYKTTAVGRNTTEPPSSSTPIEVPSSLDLSLSRDVAPLLAVRGPSPSSDSTPAYQAYHPQHASATTFASNSLNLGQPVLSPQSSFYRPSQYPSRTSFVLAVSEVHGHSASNSRDSSSTQGYVRNGVGARWSELDAPVLSSQSGPVPEWDMKQELPIDRVHRGVGSVMVDRDSDV